MLFCQEHRQNVIKENPKLSSSELVKKLAEKWSHLSKDMRKPYEISARENTLIYGEAHKNFYENLTSEQKEELARLKTEQREARRLAKLKRALRETNLPKSPGSAYNLFVRSQAKKLDVKERHEFIKECAELWKKMSEYEKKQFKKEAELEKLRYADEIKSWREQLLKEGKSDLVSLYNDMKGRRKLDDEHSALTERKKSSRKGDVKEVINGENWMMNILLQLKGRSHQEKAMAKSKLFDFFRMK
ncbi:transcription factor A, mitochondrial-like isoform X2 [Stegodyphus dumicola]|nr:transcription factor A, mitochondrial-like isoform X2 [Stegodyphus dumicola]